MEKKLDIATIAGIVSGIGLIIAAMLIGGGVGMFINIPSMLIVVGGTIAATMVNFPLHEVFRVMKYAMKTMFATQESPTKIIKQLVEYNGLVKKEGVIGLEKVMNNADNPFLKTALGYVIDGTPADELASSLKLHLIEMKARHKVGQDVFKGMGKWAPAFGMIGTLIGLVQMLASMDNPQSIGPKMAVALLTTFYGALMSNLVFLPMAGKLARRSEIELVTARLIIQGLNGIQAGISMILMENNLKAFLETESKKQELRGKKTASPESDSSPQKTAEAVK